MDMTLLADLLPIQQADSKAGAPAELRRHGNICSIMPYFFQSRYTPSDNQADYKIAYNEYSI
jgi:hypothetical protein